MRFRDEAAFAGEPPYHLLPMRFRRLPWDARRVFVSSLAGDWMIVSGDLLQQVVARALPSDDPRLDDLEAHHLLVRDPQRSTLAPLLSQYRTRKSFLRGGPALHIVVVSLRCHHSCGYCQVSRQPATHDRFDMSGPVSEQLLDRLFEWPAPILTIEFQGGEPLLHFDRIRTLVERIQARNITERRQLRFVVTSTLHDLTDAQLSFMSDHGVRLSTSLDGPQWLHDANRPRPGGGSHARTVAGIERARGVLGEDAVSALTTLTRRSLEAPTAIVEEYRRLGLRTIALRPLSPYGFARRTADRIGYGIDAYLAFYRSALDRVIEANHAGFPMEEVHASLLLSQLLSPLPHGYVDLRSPTGAGFGAVVYDYDGRVYPSDEARMLAAMGDDRFVLGHVGETVSEWMASPAMAEIMQAGVAESIPKCTDCAYLPLCGSDPIDHYARQGDAVGHRPTSDFCQKHMGLLDLLLERWETANQADRHVLEGWVWPRISERGAETG